MIVAVQKEHGYDFVEFENYQAFRSFHCSSADSSNYEVISGPQSLYFDFDGAFEKEKLLSNILTHFKTYPICVNIYSSCDSQKQSFHVIVKGIHFNDHRTNAHYAKKIAGDLANFDACVYTSKRNLRLLGSRKLNSTRIKIFDSTLYQSPEYKCRMEKDTLYMSLVTGICDSILIPDVEIPKLFFPYETILSHEDEKTLLEKIENLYPKVFKKRETRGNTIFLNRQKASDCLICQRIHHSENAILTKRGSKIIYRCFRDMIRNYELEDDEIEIPLQEETAISQKLVIPVDPDILVARKLLAKFPFA